MAARIAHVRQAREHREVAAMVLQWLQVARGFIMRPGLLGEEIRRVQPQRAADQEHALGAIAAALRSAPRPIGSIASRSGRPMQTPAERRNVRRFSGERGTAKSSGSDP